MGRGENTADAILYGVLARPNPSALDSLAPDPAAFARARELIAKDNAGETEPLEAALRNRGVPYGQAPALDLLYEHLAGVEIARIYDDATVARRAPGRKSEIELLVPAVAARLSEKIAADEKLWPVGLGSVDLLAILGGDDDSTATEAGPLQQRLLDQIRLVRGIGSVDPAILSAWAAGELDQRSDAAVTAAIERDQITAVRKLHAVLAYGSSRSRWAHVLRNPAKGIVTLHLLQRSNIGNALPRTVCGKPYRKDSVTRVGAWAEASQGISYKRCARCAKDAPQETLAELEAEDYSRVESFDQAEWERFQAICADQSLRGKIAAEISGRSDPEEIHSRFALALERATETELVALISDSFDRVAAEPVAEEANPLRHPLWSRGGWKIVSMVDSEIGSERRKARDLPDVFVDVVPRRARIELVSLLFAHARALEESPERGASIYKPSYNLSGSITKLMKISAADWQRKGAPVSG